MNLKELIQRAQKWVNITKRHADPRSIPYKDGMAWMFIKKHLWRFGIDGAQIAQFRKHTIYEEYWKKNMEAKEKGEGNVDFDAFCAGEDAATIHIMVQLDLKPDSHNETGLEARKLLALPAIPTPEQEAINRIEFAAAFKQYRQSK